MGTAIGVPTSERVLMWPVTYFWKACGVLLVDLSYNRYELWFSAAVFVSGVLNIAITPWSVCMLDGWCEDVLSTTYRRLYTRMMACTSLMSRAVIVYKIRMRLAGYKQHEDAYDREWPLSEQHRRRFRAYASSVVTACLVLIMPANLMRIYLLHHYEEFSDSMLLLFFFNVYLQNWSMCCMETHFVLLCFKIYLKFQSVNDELWAVRADVMVINRYPVALRPVRSRSGARRDSRSRCTRTDDGGDDDDDLAAKMRPSVLQDPFSLPLETAIEVLRVRHDLIRESLDQMINMFGLQLALSLIALCAMTLFDIYNEAFYMRGTISRSKFIYIWILQYMFRFFIIIITAHHTTQEGCKTKVLITEINNRHLNKNTKFELQLFLKQINYQSLDITAYDIFTLNSHLVASAIAVGITYLFVLIQFHSETA